MGKIGEGSLRNMYKGHMDKAKRGRIKSGRWGWVGRGGVEREKWRQLYLKNKQINKIDEKKYSISFIMAKKKHKSGVLNKHGIIEHLLCGGTHWVLL